MKKIYTLLTALCLFTSLNAQIVTIPNANFKAKLLAASSNNLIAKDLAGNYFKIDANNNGQIELTEAAQVSYVNVESSSITSLVGISSFSNLKYLSCISNQLTSLNLSGLTNLLEVNCSYNLITSLNLSGLSSLQFLTCNYNQISTLNLDDLSNIVTIYCDNNNLTTLNINGLSMLQNLYCHTNTNLTSINFSGNNSSLNTLHCYICALTSLDISSLQNIGILHCSANQLTQLDVSNSPFLADLRCNNNSITNLDVRGTNLVYLFCQFNGMTNLNVTDLYNLMDLQCGSNQLETLDVSTCINLSSVDFSDNSQLVSVNLKNGKSQSFNTANNFNLDYICVDDFETDVVQGYVTMYGLSNCNVNSYCSFIPGGTSYVIRGNAKLDANNNGCDVADNTFTYLKLNITSGTVLGNVISNLSGNYNLPVIAGNHTVTPVLENPTYFTVSPTNVVVNFPSQASPFTQNFCVTANGIHSDLEVKILPIIGARPGFDANYKIVYKNKGNQVESGTVNMVFDDAKMDYVSSNPVNQSSSTNQLTWNYVNLLPFETRTIDVVFNINSPMESPAINGGDILNYNSNITSGNIDERLIDNTFMLNQTVVNSYDPNDKTCLEGATISPSKVGDYVHYMIRFENNGTANAQNIVVKDMIDLAKFDIASLVPIKGSHSFVTSITAGNKVEFIFENINLPFDNANNDGYVAFKIKTKPTLVVGNTFSNTASIYFDYNFPIVTNTATTTIAALSVQDFEFSNYFSVYPNPVHDVLHITSKGTIEISSINIYNTLGQLVLVIPNAKDSKTVDVSSLASGNYFIKINSDKGTSNTKFIKK